MNRPAPHPLELVTFPGLGSAREPCFKLPTFVSHNNVALNYMERGWIRSLLATGFRYELKPGCLAVFWGAMPHKVEAFDPRGIGHSVTIPLGTFLGWPMPSHFTRQIIAGRVFFEPDESEGPADLRLLNRWHGEIATHDPEAAAIVLLELEARLRRLARDARPPRRLRRIAPRGANSQAERMLLLVAEHFRERLTIQDVATAVGMRADSAGRVFRRDMGVGLADYITECRLYHAKAMMATSDAKVLIVALDSGFGSVSQFHAIFQKHCGCTPRAFRESLRQGKA